MGVDELAVLRVAERKEAGRPLSARSAWAIIALAERDDEALGALAPSERSRAKARLDRLLFLVAKPPRSERDVRQVASALRLMFRNRAAMVSRKAAVADLPKLREDSRWEFIVTPQRVASRRSTSTATSPPITMPCPAPTCSCQRMSTPTS